MVTPKQILPPLYYFIITTGNTMKNESPSTCPHTKEGSHIEAKGGRGRTVDENEVSATTESIVVLSTKSEPDIGVDVTTSLEGEFSGESIRVAPLFSHLPNLPGKQLKYKRSCLQQTQFLQRPERLQRQQSRKESGSVVLVLRDLSRRSWSPP